MKILKTIIVVLVLIIVITYVGIFSYVWGYRTGLTKNSAKAGAQVHLSLASGMYNSVQQREWKRLESETSMFLLGCASYYRDIYGEPPKDTGFYRVYTNACTVADEYAKTLVPLSSILTNHPHYHSRHSHQLDSLPNPNHFSKLQPQHRSSRS